MFRSIQNVIAYEARPVPEPWNLVSNAPRDLPRLKFHEWRKDPATNDHFISLCEGVTPNVRIKEEDNPVCKCYGFIVDYDAPLPKDVVKHLKKVMYAQYLPNWVTRTPSDNGRLVWLLEKPLDLIGRDHYYAVAMQVAKALRFKSWLSNLDTCFANAEQYYALGDEWTVVSEDSRLPVDFIQGCNELAFKAGFRGTEMAINGLTVNLPIEEIAVLVEERFPGRWKSGEFKLGAHGRRFWDPVSDNDSGTTVCRNGMLVHIRPLHTKTDLPGPDKVFMKWTDIFGDMKVLEAVGRHARDIKEKTYLVEPTGKFVRETSPGTWNEFTAAEFRRHLRCLDYNDRRSAGEMKSECDMLEDYLKQHRKVDAAGSFLYMPLGYQVWNNKKIVCTRSTTVLPPAAPTLEVDTTWKKARRAFPFIHYILSNLFRTQGPSVPEANFSEERWLEDYEPDIQLNTLLAWLKRAYEGGAALSPKLGQIMCIVGEVDKGKTLLSTRILGPLLGGYQDGKAFFMKGSNSSHFNGSLQDAALVTLDDPGIQSAKDHSSYVEALKEIAANGTARFEQKFKDSFFGPWRGRILLTCNPDPDSMRVLPGLSRSNSDKVIMLLCSNAPTTFYENEVNERLIAEQLPHFARFLLDWTPPPSVVSSRPRFGVEAFHHPQLVITINGNGATGTVMEILDAAFQAIRDAGKHDRVFIGTSAEFYMLIRAHCMYMDSSIKNSIGLGCTLRQLVKQGRNIQERYDPRKKMAIWTIPLSVEEINKTGSDV